MLDTLSGKEVALPGLPGRPHGHAFSADGRWLLIAVASEGSGEVHIHELPGGQPVRRLTPLDTVPTHLVLSADRKRLFAAGANQDVRVWDVENGRELLTLAGRTPGRGLLRLGLLPSGNSLFLVAAGELLMWDGTPARPKR